MKYAQAAAFMLLAITHVSPSQKASAPKAQAFSWNWQDTQAAKNTIASEKNLTATERSSLLKTLTQQFKGEADPRKAAAETRIKLIDLNADGASEIIAQAVDDDFCSPTGNCSFWVFQKSATGYRLILQKGAVQNFTLQRTRTNGFIDLVLGMHGSATEQGLYLYQFSDGRYRPISCYDASWTFLDKNDEVHELKEPQVTPCTR